MIGRDRILGDGVLLSATRTRAHGPAGRLPITPEMLLGEPSGNLFGMTQDAGMGWNPSEVIGTQVLIISTQGGLREPDGRPIALGYHTGHWEIGLLVRGRRRDAARGRHRAVRRVLQRSVRRPHAGHGRDVRQPAVPQRRRDRHAPTDSLAAAASGRHGHRDLRQGTAGDDAGARGLRATCPAIIVPGGVTLPAIDGEDAGKIQSIGARFAHGLITLDDAADAGLPRLRHARRRLSVPRHGRDVAGRRRGARHDAAAQRARAVRRSRSGSTWRGAPRCASWPGEQRASPLDIDPDAAALENAMVVHAAFGGSTNLLLHIPAIAHAAGLRRPTVEDWTASTARRRGSSTRCPTARAITRRCRSSWPAACPKSCSTCARWACSISTSDRHRRNARRGPRLVGRAASGAAQRARELQASDGIDPDDVIMSADAARKHGLASTVVFPAGNIAPEGSVIKATAIDPSVIDADEVYRHRGPARVFVSERDAIAAIKGTGGAPIAPNDVIVLIGAGPLGTGMEETYQLTSALKYLPWGETVALVTDARFSGVSTGACIGHVGPGGAGRRSDRQARGRRRHRDRDRSARSERPGQSRRGRRTATRCRRGAPRASRVRPPHPELRAHPDLPDDTRLWAALQAASGGPWAGCVYDVDRIIEVLTAGLNARSRYSK